MNSISIKNINRPSSAYWNKISLAATFVAQSILGTAIASENMTMAWIAFGLQILAGLIPILTNGVTKADVPAK